jgi:pimeloyl-ACP methyl ester carboxylesterase
MTVSGDQLVMARRQVAERMVPLADGARIRTLQSGAEAAPAEDTVVLLHSAIGHAGQFRHQLLGLAEPEMRVIAYDRRGFGATTEPGAESVARTGPVAVDDLGELLDAEVASGRVHLVGAAAGGRVATEFAAAHPDRVASLTLVSALAGFADMLYPRGIHRLLPPEFLALPPYLRELGPVYRGEEPEGVEEWIRVLAEVDGRRRGPSKGVAARTTVGVADLAAMAAGRFGVGATDGATRPIGISLITGDADPYVTPEAYARLAAAVPGASLTVVAGSGHSPYWERPRYFNEVLLSRFNAHSSARKGPLA